MVFSSLLFIFLFLALNLLVYWLVDKKYRNHVLLGFSLVFYAWGGPEFLLLLIGDTFVCWLFALLIDRAQTPQQKKRYLILPLIILLGLLGVFKYTGFILGNWKALFGVPEVIPQFLLPIGISFYTFQLISYVVDVYRGDVAPQPRFWKLLLYASLFHQCIAGPIVRYETIADEIDERHVTRADVYAGIRRFAVGLAKKAVLANSCASVADSLLNGGVDALASQPAATLWLAMLFYMFQIYFDFSAYSDMAIGMGRMVGFHYLENFDHPYMAYSVQNFWRRWHISLSTWFRDYVYIPLGGSRCPDKIIVRNYLIVWSLTGFWHGASWNFIFWGLFYFAFLILERFVIKGRMPRWMGHIYTLLVVYFGWVLFRFPDSGELATVIAGMFGFGSGGILTLQTETLFLQNVFLIIFCVIACTDFGTRLRNRILQDVQPGTALFKAVMVIDAVTPIFLMLLATVALVGDSYNPFIYFRF